MLIAIHLPLHLFALIAFSVKSKIIFMFLLCCNVFINFEKRTEVQSIDWEEPFMKYKGKLLFLQKNTMSLEVRI